MGAGNIKTRVVKFSKQNEDEKNKPIEQQNKCLKLKNKTLQERLNKIDRIKFMKDYGIKIEPDIVNGDMYSNEVYFGSNF